MQSLHFLIVAFILASCTTRAYTYKILLERPQKSNALLYENDTMSISFDFTEKWINFKMYNKIEDGIRVNWDELSMSINGKAARVVHKETGAYKITEVQPPTTVPPKTFLDDAIVPTENVKFTTAMGGRSIVSINPIYPTQDYGNKKTKEKIMGRKGERITVFFPYYIKNVYYSKVFEFIIEDIIAKK